MARERVYRGLQTLRIVAALLVLVTHSGFYVSERLRSGFAFWRRGATGVELFFTLSGFVMIYSSTKLMNDPDGWKIFAERRIVRIVPMYWLATTIKVASLFLASHYVLHTRFSLFKTIASYFFLPTRNIDGQLEPVLGVGWTLNFEMFFYLLFAVALLLRVNVYKFVGIILTFLTLGAFIRKPEWPAISFYLNPIVLDFFLGMIIARECLMERHIPKKLAPLMLIAGLFSLLVFPWPDWKLPIFGVSAAVIIWATASLEPNLHLIPRWVLFLADASYVIYLFHPMLAPIPPTVLSTVHLPFPALSIGCSIIMALLVGSLIHQYLELPVTNLFRGRLRVHGRLFIHTPDGARSAE